MKNLLFIPCFNDIKNCEKVLNEIHNVCRNNFDILIINDGSKGKLNFKSNIFNLKIINLKNNFGVGFGLKMAINYALAYNYKKFCRIDSDGEHDPKYIEDFFKELDNIDFSIGKRKIVHKERITKTLSKKTINYLINKLFNLSFEDYNCGMMGLGQNTMQIIKKDYLISYPEPQIIMELCNKKFTYSVIQINQRKRYFGDSSINFFRGVDFILVTFFFILNYILNKNND